MRHGLAIIALLAPMLAGADVGRSIYLQGTDGDGQALGTYLGGLESDAPLPCANCHRESGLGTSESGQTFPPVSWRFLGQDQPRDDRSRFYSLQNKRPAYTEALVHRLLSRGINSRGEQADPLMPRYDISPQQTRQLVAYLKTLYADDDPGMDGDSIWIATITDARLPDVQRRQHLEFMRGLFAMKNAGTRGEQKRKKHSPIQRVPQFEAYRKWKLLSWELSADPGAWEAELEQYYRAQPVFVVLAPLVRDHYPVLQVFCQRQQLPCLFPHNAAGTSGDYFNFIYQDSSRQRRDYLAAKLRNSENDLLYVAARGNIEPLAPQQTDIPNIDPASLPAFFDQFTEICTADKTLLLMVDKNLAERLYRLQCPATQEVKIMLLGDSSIGYQDIVEILQRYANPNICWVTSYDKVLQRNLREIRVRVLARRFGITEYSGELLARDLFAFGLLSDSMHQLAGNFSRAYLLENMEHMLNSFPNHTYYSQISGAPNQRAIVGPVREFCPDKGAA